jgi:hypothetical protein
MSYHVGNHWSLKFILKLLKHTVYILLVGSIIGTPILILGNFLLTRILHLFHYFTFLGQQTHSRCLKMDYVQLRFQMIFMSLFKFSLNCASHPMCVHIPHVTFCPFILLKTLKASSNVGSSSYSYMSTEISENICVFFVEIFLVMR